METYTRVLKKLGKRIKELRLHKGWSQAECALEARMSAVYLSGVERGIRNPTVKNLARLAKALGVQIVDLFQ